MSRNFVNTSSQYLNRNVFLINAGASTRTINIWGRTTVGIHVMASHTKITGFGAEGAMIVYLSAGKVNLAVDDTATFTNCATTAGPSSNEWFMATGVIHADNDHRVFFNAGSRGTDATNTNTANYNRMHIGSNDGGGNYWDGQLAEIAVWTTALTDNEIALLYESRGQASLVQPEFLKCYMSMMDDADYAEFGGGIGASAGTRWDFNANNSPTVSAEYPPIVRSAGGLF